VQEALLLAQSALDFADKSGPQSQPDDITDYSSMNMEMLKDELQKRGLKVSGQKAAKQSESILFLPDRFYRETSHEMRMLGAN